MKKIELFLEELYESFAHIIEYIDTDQNRP